MILTSPPPPLGKKRRRRGSQASCLWEIILLLWGHRQKGLARGFQPAHLGCPFPQEAERGSTMARQSSLPAACS